MQTFFVQLAVMNVKDPWHALIAASLLTALALAGAAQAEEKLPDTFSLRLGGYSIRNADTVMRLDANNAPLGTYVDFADTLGGERKATIVRLDGLYRFELQGGMAWTTRVFNGKMEYGPLEPAPDATIRTDANHLLLLTTCRRVPRSTAG